MTDERTASVGKLVQIILSDDHRPSHTQFPHDFGILRWNSFLVQLAGRSSSHPGSVDQVLQCDRNSVQRSTPVAPGNLLLGHARLGQRRLPHHRDERIETGIDVLNLA
jgi:hypothetical protein